MPWKLNRIRKYKWRKRLRVHWFLARMQTKAWRKVLKARRQRWRKVLVVVKK
jgi:large subunit ribosomal protein L34